ncbi:RNA 2'-phosphotransferase [Dongia rigui]|uniref:Probable RNA 2'-phosphotransferase n=1 Tax=Dongia rigui TaxID=940149 RepID=A0ABU5DZ26_9PROT|nr:RNA 2'-phosphotransferase [Dongia rigui]MDY0872545.1 RNA 2'-phosphotransferase [Dongia rigui]
MSKVRSRLGEDRLTALSRIASHALRHEPARYGLTLDANGWVAIDAFIAALGRTDPRWQGLVAADFQEMIAASAKTRHEIDADRIRAIYGHSVPGRLTHDPIAPPAILFHGTSPQAAELILRDGLKPMSRQYVHLSPTREVALDVGRRKVKAPSLLVVDAAGAFIAGHHFYRGNDLIWLADAVPPPFIRRDEPTRP